VADAMLKSGVIPIMLLPKEYHKFIADSTLLSTFITYQNGQVHDAPGRTESRRIAAFYHQAHLSMQCAARFNGCYP
jgi:hypothetical protein